jgi:hypothetical protein
MPKKAKKRTTKRSSAVKKPKHSQAKALKVRVGEAKPISLDDHLERIRSFAASAEASNAEQGACLVADPQTGENRCLRTDPTTCKALKGTFIGGPCGA